jgi:hypothetical protein
MNDEPFKLHAKFQFYHLIHDTSLRTVQSEERGKRFWMQRNCCYGSLVHDMHSGCFQWDLLSYLKWLKCRALHVNRAAQHDAVTEFQFFNDKIWAEGTKFCVFLSSRIASFVKCIALLICVSAFMKFDQQISRLFQLNNKLALQISDEMKFSSPPPPQFPYGIESLIKILNHTALRPNLMENYFRMTKNEIKRKDTWALTSS